MRATHPRPKRSAEALRLRELLIAKLNALIHSRNLTQKQAAAWLGISQPRISQLQSGLLDRFTVDSLVGILEHAGMRVLVELTPAAADGGAGPPRSPQ